MTSVLENTARTAENRGPTNAALAAFQMAIQQERQFQDNLKEAAERRKREAAEIAQQAAQARARAQGSEEGKGIGAGNKDGNVDTHGSGANGSGADGSSGQPDANASGQGDRGASVNIQV